VSRPQTLRVYQSAAIDKLRAFMVAEVKRLLLVSPTGSGKTTIASEIIHRAIKRNVKLPDGTKRPQRVLFLAHRKELIDQCSARLDGFGVDHGVIKADHPRFLPWLPVQVASVQTLHRRLPKRDLLPPDQRAWYDFDLVIIDESHRARAATYNGILEFFPGAVVLGLTATPWRTDGKGLGELFHEVVVAAEPKQLIEEGHLVEYTGYVYDRADVELADVAEKGDDYNPDDLAKRAKRKEIMGKVVEEWQRHASGELTIVFACNVEHSKALAEEFRAAGVAAEHVDGETDDDERTAILGPEGRFARGVTRVVCNVGLLTEGYDMPAASCVVLTRLTQSVALFLQMVGRVMRPVPCACGTNFDPKREGGCPSCGAPARKRYARIHDHAGLLMMHGVPDAERDYTLTADESKQGRRSKERASAAAIRQCMTSPEGPGCFRIFDSALPACPGCGKPVPVQRLEVTQVAGEAIRIEDVARNAPDEKKRKAEFDRLVGIAIAKGWKIDWACRAYKTQFKHWPPYKWKIGAQARAKNYAAKHGGNTATGS
jgi:DNA repair protein RadD